MKKNYLMVALAFIMMAVIFSSCYVGRAPYYQPRPHHYHGYHHY